MRALAHPGRWRTATRPTVLYTALAVGAALSVLPPSVLGFDVGRRAELDSATARPALQGPLPRPCVEETESYASFAAQGPPPREDGRRTTGRLPVNLLRGVGGVFARESLPPLLVGAAATGLGSLLDDDVSDAIGREDDSLSDAVETIGGPVVLGAATLGLFIGGRFADGPRFRAMTYDLATAAVVNVAYTFTLKAAVKRERPNQTDEKSFPSGHTSNAFTLASVASAHYGKKLGIPAYAVAAFIGATRLRKNAHWLSDVLAGATLGLIVGRAVVRQNDRPLAGAAGPLTSVTVTPLLGSHTRGVLVAVSF